MQSFDNQNFHPYLSLDGLANDLIMACMDDELDVAGELRRSMMDILRDEPVYIRPKYNKRLPGYDDYDVIE